MRNFIKESILFQSTAFFDEMTLVFDELKELKENDILDSEQIHRLSKIIKNKTNLNIVIDVTPGMGPAITIPQIDRNNPLINNVNRSFLSSTDGLDMINKAGGVIQGTVNIKQARVTGVFAEIKATLYLGVELIRGNQFTSSELAAMVFHEIGHLFTYFEFFSRTVVTNQILAGLSKVTDGVENQDRREIALVSAKQALRLDKFDISQLKGVDAKTIEIVFVDAVVTQTRSELGYNLYAESSWEYLSDQFAARHGAGADLARALEKIYRKSGNIAFRSLGMYFLVEAIKIVLIYSSVGISMAVILMLMDSQDGGGYDLPGARLKRIRDQATEYIKDKTLSNSERSRILEEIHVIDSVIKGLTNRKQLVTYIHEFISKRTRDERAYRKLQQELESLALNDLYIKAAEFKLLG